MDFVATLVAGFVVLLGLSIVVFLHEGGHFLAARWAGVDVEAFAIGWGKVLWSWKPGPTEYRICLFPIGGYCKMRGEEDLIAAMGRADGQVEATQGSLFSVPAWKRIVISAAGPLVNFVSAIVLFIVLALVGTPSVGPESRILLAAEVDGRTGTAAEVAGLKTGDRVLAVNDKPVRSFAELQATITTGAGKTDVWTLDRDGTQLKANVSPKPDANGHPLVGVYPFNPPRVKEVEAKSPAALAGFEPGDLIVSIDGLAVSADQLVYARLSGREPSHTLEVERGGTRVSLTFVSEGAKTPLGLSFVVPSYPAVGLGPLEAVSAGFGRAVDLLSQMIAGLGRLFVGKENAVQSLSGPVGIVGQGSKAIEYAFGLGVDFGVATLVNFLSFLSLALFLMNLLPIPALDGGSIVVSLIEMARRKRLGIRTLIVYQQVGVFLVLGLLLFTTLNDFGLFGKV